MIWGETNMIWGETNMIWAKKHDMSKKTWYEQKKHDMRRNKHDMSKILWYMRKTTCWRPNSATSDAALAMSGRYLNLIFATYFKQFFEFSTYLKYLFAAQFMILNVAWTDNLAQSLIRYMKFILVSCYSIIFDDLLSFFMIVDDLSWFWWSFLILFVMISDPSSWRKWILFTFSRNCLDWDDFKLRKGFQKDFTRISKRISKGCYWERNVFQKSPFVTA